MRSPVPVLVPPSAWDACFYTRHPAFEALAPAASRFAHFAAWPAVDAWNDALRDLALATATGAALRFVPQPPRRKTRDPIEPTTLYEVRICELGEVPSRAAHWHDFLNMLCWATFTRAKRALNARQRRAVRAWLPAGATRLPGARTREQDALAILDEGGAVVPCLAPCARELQSAIACDDLDAVADLVRAAKATVIPFGHASFEHLVARHATVRAMPVVLPMSALPRAMVDLVDAADRALALRLDDPCFLTVPCEDPALPMSDALFDFTPRGDRT